ncbi:putative acetyltransferase [Paenibacillus turicensis]|uniref:Acetyltransferase n=1 Tax=Paenibacillus turicensis TaxID=160487 RepID=A0ABS4FME2_9BACL|nr:GNAT family N-acetyltransferase [Paenibacillus turicensis]MBP1903745.1 putative acetyltransferase [Paenibacillus turicensis]
MEIKEMKLRSQELIHQLVHIWRKSVVASHTFLTSDDIDQIQKYVPMALEHIKILLIVEEQGKPVGFAGADGSKLEMLFIDPDLRGKGIGKQIVQNLVANYQVKEVAVNEQNPLAKGFYEHMGFKVYRREPIDEQGNPFPILFMKL